MRREAIIGLLLIFVGIGLYAYYDQTVRPEIKARELLVEGKITFERGSKESVNNSINIFSKVIARYPHTRAAQEAYYYIGQSYEKLGLNRLAYLKYNYILKNNRAGGETKVFSNIDSGLAKEIKTRMAKLTIKKHRTEEGVHQLLDMLNNSSDRDFRSRIYTELGHTYLKNRNIRKASRMFDIALTENGENEEAVLGKARSYKNLGQDHKAYDLYEYFLKYYGDFSNYSSDVRSAYLRQAYWSGIRNYRKGRYSAAIGYFNRLLRYFPNAKKAENALYWIGESYYATKSYNMASKYFARVLSNGYYHKDQDARIKRGYCYFMNKRFDLAAREFQLYLNSYPNGRHALTAKKWKDMSTREIMYRVKDKFFIEDTKKDTDGDIDDEFEDEDDFEIEDEDSGAVNEVKVRKREDKYENVAEL